MRANIKHSRSVAVGSRKRVVMRLLTAVLACVIAAITVLNTVPAWGVQDDPNYYLESDLSLDANSQQNELTTNQGFKFYISTQTQGQASPTNFKITLTMPADAVKKLNIPNFSDQWGGKHTISEPVQDDQGNWVVTITWPVYDATSAIKIPGSIDWIDDAPQHYKLPITVQYQSDQQPLTSANHKLEVLFEYTTPRLRLLGADKQSGGSTFSTDSNGVKYIDPDKQMYPIVYNFSIDNDKRRVSSYDICDVLPTYQGIDGKTYTAQLSDQSKSDGWTLSADGTEACFTADKAHDPYGQLERYHTMNMSAPQYSLGLLFPYLPLTDITDGMPSAKITNSAYAVGHALNPSDTVEQKTNLATKENTAVIAGIAPPKGLTKRAPADFSRASAHLNTSLDWSISWSNESNIPFDHLQLADESTDGTSFINDNRFKLVGIHDIAMNAQNAGYWWPKEQSLPQAGDTVVVATATDGSTDSYPVKWNQYGVSEPITFDASKTYTSAQIHFPDNFKVAYKESLQATVQTQWIDPDSFHYSKTDTANNTFINNAKLTTQIEADKGTEYQFIWANTETHLLPDPPEELKINAFAYNNNLKVDGSDPLLIYSVQAHLDPTKDYKNLRVVAPLPPGFTMKGTHNQNASGLAGNWNKTFVDSYETIPNYKGTGQDYLIFHLNQDAVKEAFALYPNGWMWIEVNGSVNFSESYAGNNANKVAAYITADNAPVQAGDGTIKDTQGFGPNENIVFSQGSYTTLSAEGDSFIKSLFGTELAAQTSSGLGEPDLQFVPGRTVYWTLTYNNASAIIHRNLQMYDIAPSVGDVMPVDGQQRGTDFPVSLSGPISAVSYSFDTGKNTVLDPATLHIKYITDPKATGMTWKQIFANDTIKRYDSTLNDPNIPWEDVTAFRVDFGNIPAFTRVRLIMPTIIPQDIGTQDEALRAKGTVKAVNAAAFSADDRDPIQTTPSSISTTFGAFQFRKVDPYGKTIQAAKMQLTGEMTGWNGDKQTYASGTAKFDKTYENVDHIDFKNMPAGHYTLKELESQDGYKNTSWQATVDISYTEDESMKGTPKVTIQCVDTSETDSSIKKSGGCAVSEGGSTVTFTNAIDAPLHSMPQTGGWGVYLLVASNVLLLLIFTLGISVSLRRN